MNIRLSIAGTAIGSNQLPDFVGDDGLPLFQLHGQQSVKLSAPQSTQRGQPTAPPIQVLNLQADDPVCLHLANGMTWWMSAQDAADQFHTSPRNTSRQAQRANGDETSISIDPNRVLRPSAQKRSGIGIDVVSAIDGFGLDLSGKSAYAIGEWMERRQIRDGKAGVYRLLLNQAQAELQALPSLPATSNPQDAPYLLFIHGTASNTLGGFGKLWQGREAGGPAHPINQLSNAYGENVLAFEYPSITVSAIKNTLYLAQQLPAHAELHIVSHSQGGLLGELLCLGHGALEKLDQAALHQIFSVPTNSADNAAHAENVAAYAEQLRDTQALLAVLQQKQFKITRFVRIACPALGTSLASGRLDRWLSVFRYLLELAGNVLFADQLLAFLLAVIKQRTNPRTMPGFEGMMPGSALQNLLNRPDLLVNADLSVIAGQIKDDSLLGWLKLVVPQHFFAGGHDLVVNTGSMYGGLRRANGHGRVLLDAGPVVNHFNYFANASSVRGLLAVLLQTEDGSMLFSPLREDQRAQPARSGKQGQGTGAAWPVYGDTPAHRQQPAPNKIKLSLKHGDLAYALYPVCVGHYLGDSIVSAENQLDLKLGGILRERAQLGIYPGRLGSWTISIAQQAQSRPGGAIVVGLGQVGELTPGALETSLTSALIDYALQVADWHDARFGEQAGLRQARMSFLLIGTGAGGISIEDSINAILHSVKNANTQLLNQTGKLRSHIDQVEILELFHDVALQAAHAMQHALRDIELQNIFDWSSAEVVFSGSGLHRAHFEQEQSWWQRTEISFDAKRQELRFVALTNRARAEQSLVAGQMKMAQNFVRQAIGNSDNRRDISRTLFEMLIPNRLKEFAPERQDIVLMLDDEAACFPWEMMEDRWSSNRANSAPPAVDAGLIRQLKTSQFRQQPQHCSENNILVIGNPQPCIIGQQRLLDLPGAKHEAELVAGLMNHEKFSVQAVIEENADSILIALHGQAYRILHLAGHGVHELLLNGEEMRAENSHDAENAPRRISGMVIGENVFLSPADVEQMRWVPELVFINCCHLGTTASKLAQANELAANLAAQFIRMGVKAVVAAGWEVDDAAASCFAEEFYQSMLAGQAFGRAVQLARKRVYLDHPHVNTWGAYQCYGDPDFRLNTIAESFTEKAQSNYFSALELVSDLNNLKLRARFGEAQVKDIEEILARVEQQKHAAWFNRADVAAAIGQAYGELELYEAALRHLDKAIHAEQAEMPLLVLEQRANFKARCASNLARQPAHQAIASQMFAEAQQEIEHLLAFAPTMERHNISASCWKRRAICATNSEERKQAMAHMATAYQLSANLGDKKGIGHNHAKLNLLLTQLLGAEQYPLASPLREQISQQCDSIFVSEEAFNRSTPDFWAASAMPQSMLVKALVMGDLAQQFSDIVAQFQHAKQPGASKREMASVIDNLDFIACMLDDFASAKADAALVREIAGKLAQL